MTVIHNFALVLKYWFEALPPCFAGPGDALAYRSGVEPNPTGQGKLYDNPQVTDTIGWVYYKKGVYQTARDYLKQSVEKDQKNAIFQYHLGMAERKLGNQDEARRDLLNAVTLDPQSPEAALARAALAQQ